MGVGGEGDCTRGRVSGSQWRERRCVNTVTTHPPSSVLYLHTVYSSTHSHLPSLSLSEWSGRQCASTGRERVRKWEWRRLCTSTAREREGEREGEWE